MRGASRWATLAVVATLLAACGNTSEDRGLTGAGLGAAGGAILGAVTGLSVLDGALIGTAVGGVAGLLTDKDDIDIGDPIWETWFGGGRRSSDGHVGQLGGSSSAIASTQSRLRDLGYDPGPIDGIMGPKTRAAIRQYQRDNSLAVDGRSSSRLNQHLAQQ